MVDNDKKTTTCGYRHPFTKYNIRSFAYNLFDPTFPTFFFNSLIVFTSSKRYWASVRALQIHGRGEDLHGDHSLLLGVIDDRRDLLHLGGGQEQGVGGAVEGGDLHEAQGIARACVLATQSMSLMSVRSTLSLTMPKPVHMQSIQHHGRMVRRMFSLPLVRVYAALLPQQRSSAQQKGNDQGRKKQQQLGRYSSPVHRTWFLHSEREMA